MGRSRLPRVCTRESLCALPGLTADTPLAGFSSRLALHCPSLPTSLCPGEEGWDGSYSRTGRSEGRALTSLSLLSFENCFCPPRSHLGQIWTQLAATTHAWPVGGTRKAPAQLFSRGSHRIRWSPHPTAFPVLHPSAKNHCRVQACPPPPQHIHVHVPVPPTHTVVQRPRAELVCT